MPTSANASENKQRDIQNNMWYLLNDSNTVFVFIHGFFSKSETCWRSSDGTFWPDLVSTDTRLQNPSVYLAGYYTDLDSGGYKIADCAKEVFDSLRRPCVNGMAPLEKDNIVFVCHSLGGIVARYMVERFHAFFASKAVGLVLMASPSYGSDYATKFSTLIKFYKNGIAGQLQKANGSLRELDDRFRSLVHDRVIPRLVGAEAVEHHFLFHNKWLPGFAPVVGEDSASRYFGATRTLPGTDHWTCVKPTSHAHVAHKFLVSTYKDVFLPIAFARKAKACPEPYERAPDALFEAYEPVDQQYYLLRELDKKVQQSAEMFSVWIYGRSGIGKTACTRYETYRVENKAVQVYIGALAADNVDHHALLSEIYFTLCGINDISCKDIQTTRQLIESIGVLLAAQSPGQGIVLVIDEIPIMAHPEAETSHFIRGVLNALRHVRQKSGAPRVSVIFTSIFDPTLYVIDEEQKIGEQLRFICAEDWTENELGRLIDMIVDSMDLELNDTLRSGLIELSEGSPRFIKTFFKDVSAKCGSPVNLAEMVSNEISAVQKLRVRRDERNLCEGEK